MRRVGKCEWWVGVHENEDIFLSEVWVIRGASLLLRGRGLRWLLGGAVPDWHMPTGNALI